MLAELTEAGCVQQGSMRTQIRKQLHLATEDRAQRGTVVPTGTSVLGSSHVFPTEGMCRSARAYCPDGSWSASRVWHSMKYAWPVAVVFSSSIWR